MNHLVQNNRILSNGSNGRVATYSFLFLSPDLSNNFVIFGFSGTPGYTQKISLDCDERHHLPQTQGTSLSEQICFSFFSSINIHQKKAQRQRDGLVFHLLFLSELIHFLSVVIYIILFSVFFFFPFCCAY